jgi:antitoxin FitA
MAALTIRDVSEDAVRTMKIRAAQAGQSLQAYLRSLIEREAARPTVAEAVEQARRQAQRRSTMRGRSLRRAHLTGGLCGRRHVASRTDDTAAMCHASG